jgi:GAF domain-containing protein
VAIPPTSSNTAISPDTDIFAAYPRILKLLTLYSSIGLIFLAIIYWQTQAWQIFAGAISQLGSLVFTILAYQQAKGRRLALTGILVFLSLSISFAFPMLLWNHAETYLITAGALVAMLASVVLIEQWKHRVAVVAIYLLLSILASEVQLVTRLDAREYLSLKIYLFAITLAVILHTAWLFIRKIEIRTIKARLLVSFFIVSVIPLTIIVGVTTSLVIRQTENSAFEILTTVAKLKEGAINTWMENLEETVHQELAEINVNGYLLDLIETTPGSSKYINLGNEIQQRLEHALDASIDINEYLILDKSGLVLLSTDASHNGIDIDQAVLFREPSNRQSGYAITENTLLGGKVLLIAMPILNRYNQPAGFFVGNANLERLALIMRQGTGTDEAGKAYLVASDLTLLTDGSSPGPATGDNKILTPGVLDAILGKQNGTGAYENQQGVEIIVAYQWLEDLDIAIFAEQVLSEVLSPVTDALIVISAVSLLLILGALVFGLSISNSIGRPLAELTSVSKRIATGELDLEASVIQHQSEISDLGEAFNKMTHQLRILINDLERRVQERTNELETRNAQLIAASQLGSSVTSYLDLDELVQQAVILIQDRFSLYYVGLFTFDETRTWAILKAGTGRAGRSMVERGHKIKIGEGMIGWCIQHGRARIALQAGEDPVRLATPDLPETRSEAAIPLRSRGLVIGALTIQSNHSNAFDEAMITIFQTMADQIAVAIDNAMLINQAQKAIETTRRAYGELSHRAWVEQLSSKQIKAYCSEHGVAITSQVYSTGDNPGYTNLDAVSTTEDGEVYLPIKMRGSVLGVLKAQKTGTSGEWSEEETEILRTLTEQLGAALDSARLFEETLNRAEKERMIGQITSRVRETLDIETVLKTATLEIRKALDLEEVEVRMNHNIAQDQKT